MNGVCTNVIHLTKQRLQYYGGNYDTFIRTKMELEENQAKRYQWEQDQIAHMKVYTGCFKLAASNVFIRFDLYRMIQTCCVKYV